MRRSSVVAIMALIAMVALAGLPAPAGSISRSLPGARQAATITPVLVNAPASAPAARGSSVDASATEVLRESILVEPGRTPKVPAKRKPVDQPATAMAAAWKPPKYTLTGTATFYDHGTTAMRLPAGTVVRICGPGGCLLRTVTDYGPQRSDRIIDLYRPDFFQVCGCPSWSGTAKVTVAIY